MTATAAWFLIANNRYFRKCEKCAGAGHIAAYAYYDEGICFSCAGKGYKGRGYASVESFNKAEERRAAKEAAEFAKQQLEAAANIAAYQLQQEEAERAYQARLAAQEFIDGALGEVVEISGKVVASFSVETKFGVSRLVKIQAGNAAVKFFSSANFAFGLTEGDEVKVYGELVSRELYEGNKETTIKKAKLAA